jgi:hypothetical protein
MGTSGRAAVVGAVVAIALVVAGCTVRTPGAVTDRRSFAAGINNGEWVVGSQFTPSLPARTIIERAFVARAGQRAVELGTLPGDTASAGYGINDAGTVVGYSESLRAHRAMRWTAGTGMRALPVPAGADTTEARAINNAGLIVGLVESTGDPASRRAAAWVPDTDTAVRLPLPEGATGAQAADVNERGQIVGWAGFGIDRPYRAVRWEPAGEANTWTAELLPCTSSCRATAINVHGEIVGYDGSRPILWALPGYQRVELSARSAGTATDVNARGDIVGHDGRDAVVWRVVEDGPHEERILGDAGDVYEGAVSGWAINDHDLTALTLLSEAGPLVAVRRQVPGTGGG